MINWRKYCPKHLLHPTPVHWRFWLPFDIPRYSSLLSSYANCLECSTFNIWWMRAACVVGGVYLFSDKQFQSCFINTISDTRHVIHNDYKLIKNTSIVFVMYWFVLTELSKNSRSLRPYIPCLPGTFSPLPWIADTTSQPVNAW